MDALHPPGPQLSVVIPAYNECDNLGPLIDEIEAVLGGMRPFEVIVVDDGSSDATAQVIGRLAAQRSWLRLETHAQRRGQSAGICTGVEAARAPIIALLDGDGQNDPADIPALLTALEADGIAMAIGFRRKRRDSWVRRISSRIANGVRAALLDDGVPDTGCGLKAFYRRDFLALPRFDHMHRFLPALIRQQGGAIRSIPVNHRPRRRGKSNYGIHDRLWAGLVDLLGVMWLARRRI
jgi:dolichol-phosphate mannosyltransferase